MSLIDGLLTHVCTVKRPTVTHDQRGGDVVTLATLSEGASCLVNQASDSLVDKIFGKHLNMTHTAFFEISMKGTLKTNDILTDLAPADNPTAIESDDLGPLEFRVIDAQDPNNLGDHLEARLEQMANRHAVA